MLSALGLCLLGLCVLVVGAELLTRGGSALAARLGVPPIVIGLTVVAVGTSAPELAVSIDAAAQGNGALAVGNIAGTNTVNVLLILGLSAFIRPLGLHVQTLRLDLPVMVIAAIALMVMAMGGHLTQREGLVLVAAGALYTVIVVHQAQRESRAIRAEFQREYATDWNGAQARRQVVANLTALGVGIAVIALGADWFVDGSVALARIWGVSDAFIGLTVVAIGTSSPELVTTILSTLKGERDIAVGNLLGSSVYNIFFILGAACLVTPQGIPVTTELIWIDIPVMALVALVCIPVFLSGRIITRLEGGLFVAAYATYLACLVVGRT